jgi:ethanolamine utilization protein EutA
METMTSVGIDIGTTTTQLIFSSICLSTDAVFGSVPKVRIKSKDVLYESLIYETPLKNGDEIDGDGVRKILEEEYLAAHIRPEDISTGAVIITGESARKRNAAELIKALSSITGRFVVTEAGPDLESVLSGKGAGAGVLSEKTGKSVANMDIGGGTTNISVFRDGYVVDTACLEIGGRHINLDSAHRIISITSRMQMLLQRHSIVLHRGTVLTEETGFRIAGCMTDVLAGAVGRCACVDTRCMYTNHGLRTYTRPDIITVSGGVADCIWSPPEDMYRYHDVGVFLGRALYQSPYFAFSSQQVRAAETVRATVIGAGNFSMEVSGSTVAYDNCTFPLKNVPVFHVAFSEAGDIHGLAERIETYVSLLYPDSSDVERYAAAAFRGMDCPSYGELNAAAGQIAQAQAALGQKHVQLIVISEADIAKALGQCLARKQPRGSPLLCLDSIDCSQGDYIDIGEPVAHGRAVPVVIKTLLFPEASFSGGTL